MDYSIITSDWSSQGRSQGYELVYVQRSGYGFTELFRNGEGVDFPLFMAAITGQNLKKRSQMVATDGICGKDIDF